MRHPFSDAAARLALWLALAVTLFPIGWMVLTSVKPADVAQLLPPVWAFRPTLSNYVDVLTGHTYTSQAFWLLLLHSAVVTACATALALVAGVPAAYALARVRFRARRSTASWILSTIMFPPAVAVVPFFIIAARLRITDTYPVLVVPYAAFVLPMVIWMLRSTIRQIPYEIEEAAMMDGAARLQIIWHVVLPLLMPGIVAAALLSSMVSWNEFLFALALTRSHVQTAPIGINEFTSMYGTQWGDVTAAATVTVAPILVMTFVLRKRLVEGLTFGAVK